MVSGIYVRFPNYGEPERLAAKHILETYGKVVLLTHEATPGSHRVLETSEPVIKQVMNHVVCIGSQFKVWNDWSIVMLMMVVMLLMVLAVMMAVVMPCPGFWQRPRAHSSLCSRLRKAPVCTETVVAFVLLVFPFDQLTDTGGHHARSTRYSVADIQIERTGSCMTLDGNDYVFLAVSVVRPSDREPSRTASHRESVLGSSPVG